MSQIGRRPVDPVLPSGREDIDVDRVFVKMNSCGTFGGMIMMSPAFMMYFRPCEYTSARPSVIQVTCSLTWCVSGTTAPFFADPLHERDVRSVEVLPVEKIIDLFHRLRVEVEELGPARQMRADIRQDPAARSVLDLRERAGVRPPSAVIGCQHWCCSCRSFLPPDHVNALWNGGAGPTTAWGMHGRFRLPADRACPSRTPREARARGPPDGRSGGRHSRSPWPG